jgi:hypothetical protein
VAGGRLLDGEAAEMTMTMSDSTTEQDATSTGRLPTRSAPPAAAPAAPVANNPEHVRPSALRKLLRED